MCSTIAEQSVQTASTLFNIFENKGKVKSILIERLIDLNLIQHPFNKLSTFFYASTMLDDLFRRTKHLVQQSVECTLKQLLKPFKRVLRTYEAAVRKLCYLIAVNGRLFSKSF